MPPIVRKFQPRAKTSQPPGGYQTEPAPSAPTPAPPQPQPPADTTQYVTQAEFRELANAVAELEVKVAALQKLCEQPTQPVGVTVTQVEAIVNAAIDALPEPPAPPAVDMEAIVAEVLKVLPPPEKGDPGESVDIDVIVKQVLSRLPPWPAYFDITPRSK